jgi:hypothetical protein
VDGVTAVWLREDEELPVLVVVRVRSVAAGVEVEVLTEGRRLLVTPSTYLGDEDDPRPLFTEDEPEDILLLLPLSDDERPVEEDEERPLLEETRWLLPLYEAELLPLVYVRPELRGYDLYE